MSSQGIKAYNWTFVANEFNRHIKNDNFQYAIWQREFSHIHGFIQFKCKIDENEVKRIIGNNTRETNIVTSPEQVIEQFKCYPNQNFIHSLGTFIPEKSDSCRCRDEFSKKTQDEAFIPEKSDGTRSLDVIKALNWTFSSKEINLNRNSSNLQYIIYRIIPSLSCTEGFIQLRVRGDENEIKKILGNNEAKAGVHLNSPLQIITLFEKYNTPFHEGKVYEVGTFMDKDFDDICSYALTQKTRDEAFEILKREAPSFLFAHWSEVQRCLDHFFSNNQK